MFSTTKTASTTDVSRFSLTEKGRSIWYCRFPHNSTAVNYYAHSESSCSGWCTIRETL